MNESGGKKMAYEKPRLTVLVGGKAGPRTHAERELERSLRALVYGMEGRKGKNLRNAQAGRTHPARQLVRRFQEAKRLRRDAVNYPKCKASVREIDRYVDRLFGMEPDTTGPTPRAA